MGQAPRRRTAMAPPDARAARSAALDSLARRDRGSAELRLKLVEKGFDPLVAADVVERLLAEGLLDDRRTVENFVAQRAARGCGPVRIRSDLLKLRLPGELIEECLAAFPDWIARMRDARRKKFGALLPNGPAERVRQARFLHYRGFTGAQISFGLGLESALNEDEDS